MKLRPIIFSTPMIQAILNGTKSQTRRIVKPQPIDNTEVDGNFFEGNHMGYVKVDGHPDWRNQFASEFAPWQVGDVIWVRETTAFCDFGEGYVWCYRADQPDNDDIKWKSSIYMPFEAARLFLRITSIRVERLHDISEADAIAEGVEPIGVVSYKDGDRKEGTRYRNYLSPKLTTHPDHPMFHSAAVSYSTLWMKINGKASYNENPWVWVVEFERVDKPQN